MKTEMSMCNVSLNAPVSFGGTDRNDGDWWDEASAFTGVMSAGIGGFGVVTGSLGAAPIAGAAGLASLGLAGLSYGLNAADDAFGN
jgi:hypothetical protein